VWDCAYDCFKEKKGFINMKRTFQPNRERRKKKMGFMARMETFGGRRILSARRRKKRKINSA
jgi:large subunit ribosomal protein L34